jgi:hypothetical protein
MIVLLDEVHRWNPATVGAAIPGAVEEAVEESIHVALK